MPKHSGNMIEIERRRAERLAQRNQELREYKARVKVESVRQHAMAIRKLGMKYLNMTIKELMELETPAPVSTPPQDVTNA